MYRHVMVLVIVLFVCADLAFTAEPAEGRSWILKKDKPSAVLGIFKNLPQNNVGHIKFKWDEKLGMNDFLVTIDIRDGIAVFYLRGLDGQAPYPLSDSNIMEIRWQCPEGWCVWVNEAFPQLNPRFYQRRKFDPQAENMPF